MEGLDEIKELLFRCARGIWKYRWIGIGLAWVVFLVGVVVVDQIENQYKAETKLFIDSSSILKPLLKGLAVESDVDTAVQLMVRQLLSRPNLERVIRRADLDLEAKNSSQMESMIHRIRGQMNVGLPGKNSSIYTISYTDTDRERAKRIVQIMLDIFVEDTLGKTDSESDTAIEFLDAQIRKYDQLLQDAEESREAFKRKNIGLMPQDGANYFDQLQQGKVELEQANLLLAEAENRSKQIQSQIIELKSNESAPQAPVRTSLDLRIEQQEGRVDELLLLYTDQHPDVINAQQVLQALQQRKQIEIDETVQKSTLDQSPVYQNLQILLVETEANISSLQTRVNAMEKSQAELKKLVDIVPKIESEMQRLNRDYEVHKKNYNELVARREQAKISEDVEAGGDQLKFRIIEPPFVSSKPSYPNRILFDSGVFVAAIGIGYGISLLFSFFRPVFYNHNDIRKVLTTPILGSIKKFDTPKVLSKRRVNLTMFSLLNMLLVCVAGYLIFLHGKSVSIVDYVKSLVI